MALTKGSRKLFDWLRMQPAGTVVSYADVMSTANWNEASLKTYIRKNKIAPFLQPIEDQHMKVLMDGSELSETFFDETFTQTAPRKLTLSAGDRFEGNKRAYQLVEPLGQGAVGHVWSARPDDNATLVAAKVMQPKTILQESKLPNVRERFRREARNGSTLDHPNIVRYLDDGAIERNPFLIMELADRSIADQLKRDGTIPEEETAEIIQAVVAGLGHLHAKGCPHRDVKPANILEFAGTIKVGDLGIVKWSDFDTAFTRGGTITRQSVQLGSWFYMAPEQQESPHEAVDASDVYALGVTWVEMLEGRLPSPQAIGARAYKLPPLRDGIANLIVGMVEYQPADRPSLAEIEDTIERAYA